MNIARWHMAWLSLAVLGVAQADEPIGYSQGAALLSKYGCQACHKPYETTPQGPSLQAIAARYSSDPTAIGELETSVLNGSTGAWGTASAMPPYHVPEADLRPLVEWILSFKE